ncbi:glutamine-synthetase adenylyltransferase [Epibacterium ulvae]|uniref:[protein-PII] uridylyltransferase family protein n=1 Tax=Epibacterium ulvae TaxID=1156985 RepID=UPI002491FFC3|nr:glutamine-synthetase adenylyltransferase [Epibacterium ulvae]
MADTLNILRVPHAFDADLGRETRDLIPDLTAEQADLVVGAAGSSPYLKDLLTREAHWIAEALSAPHAAVATLLQECGALSPDQLKPGLRQAKRRLALLTALCDLSGGWHLEQVTGALTDFAGCAADVALKAEIATLIRRKKLPGLTPDDVETAGGLAVLAMGKMGAFELNYSSDIDLICLFDESRFAPDDFFDARQALVRATRNMCSTLSDRTADGYVFRTDLRLRPDPAVTPVCIAMEAAERYYESLGRTWERAAYIKARTCAGDIAAGEAFLSTLSPFVWRRHLDFAAIQDAHDMRLRIRENKGTGSDVIVVAGHDMKLGRGGIREIEFFTQTQQLIAGGRDDSLRLRGTVESLFSLARKNWIPLNIAETLSDHYRAHREVEHRIQMVHDAQTHRMPKTEEGLARVACLMGCSVEEMQKDVGARLREVHQLTEGFFAPDPTIAAPTNDLPTDLDAEVLERWHSYPALRSQRAQQIFQRIRPELLSRLAQTAKPSEALLALDGFLAGLPAGVQLFSLFEANPQLMDLLMDIVGTSPELASYLSRNASVFDAVIAGDFFQEWPTREELLAGLQTRVEGEDDYERKLDAFRAWKKEWHFRIGVHHLRDLISGEEAGCQYAQLAEVVIAALAPVVACQFSTRHGPPPGRGLAVVAMGSLGAGQIHAKSDLDLITVYDPGDQEMSEGARPLAARPYYARLTQALITALTAPMAQGRLYEVDMRLRPSGTQGPVATSLKAFRDYQHNQAWVWEHLALTRARGIAGDPTLVANIEEIRSAVLSRPPETVKILQEVTEMRLRLETAKPSAGILDVKTGRGRMMEVELTAQTASLLAAKPVRSVREGLNAGVVCGWLSERTRAVLEQAYDRYWAVQTTARLVSDQPLISDQLGKGTARVLAHAGRTDRLSDLEKTLEKTYETCDDLITQALLQESWT